MTAATQKANAIVAGYDWTIRIEVDRDAFPAGVALVGHVRRRSSDVKILATVSTDNGHVARVDDRSVDVTLPGAVTASWPPGTVTFDLVRTDLPSDQYLGFRLIVGVVQPVTRGL